MIGFGGASPISQFGRQVFQEIDQMAIMRGCVKYADRIHNVKRIPQQINFAFQKAMTGKPGPVYLDWPGDLLYQKVEENQVDWSYAGRPIVQRAALCRAEGDQRAGRRDRQAPSGRSSPRAAG